MNHRARRPLEIDNTCTHCGRTRTGMASNSGFTLIELVIAIVVLATAASGVLMIFATATAHSADPQIRVQARAIAEAYMDEILLQPHDDPDGESESDRARYDDVTDYDGLEERPTDQFGDPVANLGDYTVTVVVSGSDPAEIQVEVGHSSGQVNYSLYGERYDY